MPHISPRQLDKQTLKNLYEVLFTTTANRFVSKKQQEGFFSELFTHTEKIMLGKRIMAIVLLSRGVSSYKTGKLLQLSETTTNKLRNRIERGRYDNIIVVYKKYKKGPLGRYIDELMKPLPRYGTSPSSWIRQKLDE